MEMLSMFFRQKMSRNYGGVRRGGARRGGALGLTQSESATTPPGGWFGFCGHGAPQVIQSKELARGI